MWSKAGLARAAKMNATATARMRLPRAAAGTYRSPAIAASRRLPAPRGFAPPARGTMVNGPARAMNGKKISRIVAGGVVGGAAVGTFRNNSGPAADRVRSRPTGVYGF